MTHSTNSERDFNELLFENKNKAYGAYALRKAESDTIARSMLITFGSICILMTAVYFLNKNEKADSISIESIIEVVMPMDPPPTTPDPIVENAKPKVKEIVPFSDDLNLKVEDKPVEKDPKANELLVLNKNGTPEGEVDSTEHKDVPPVDPPLPPVDPNIPVYGADEPPVFDGDIYKFIRDHLNYPQIAKENGTQGIVGISFIVERDGSVSTIKTLSEVGDGCTQEAIRVIKLLPKWKPGKNKGMPVRVIFNVPIKFRLQ